MNVTLVPAQIVVAEAEAETEGVTNGFTVIVIPELVAVVVVAQAALLVIVHATVLPFANAALEYVALFVPTLAPFNVHW